MLTATCTLLAATGSVTAQSSSPYSRYGLGYLRSTAFSANRAMGELSAPYYSAVHINFTNPASYASLLRTTLEVGANVEGANIQTTDSLYQTLNGNVSHLAFAFVPKPDKWAVSIGMLPFSTLNYTFIQNLNTPELGTFRQVYAGKGSLYNVYIGGAYKIKGFSVGANLGYVFGKLDYQKTISFPDSVAAYTTRNVTNLNVKGFAYNVGVQYTRRIFHNSERPDSRNDIFATVGAFAGGGVKLNTNLSNYWDRVGFSNSSGFTTVDTVVSEFNKKDKISMPVQAGIGVMFGNEKFWTIGIDFKYANWRNFSSPLANDNLKDSWRLSLGFQIIPDYDDRKFFKRVQYRAGFYYGKSEISFAGRQLSELAATTGFGFPLKNVARLNISGQVGTRGSSAEKSINETFYRVTFGFVLNDIWFVKRKFD